MTAFPQLEGAMENPRSEAGRAALLTDLLAKLTREEIEVLTAEILTVAGSADYVTRYLIEEHGDLVDGHA